MSLFSESSGPVSVQQYHPVVMMNEVQQITGKIETLGMPHPYINQNDLELFKITEAINSPWSHLNIPVSQNDQILIIRNNIQMFAFTDPASNEEFRLPPNRHALMITMPIAVLRGRVPFMGEATAANFLDNWKGQFVPVTDAEIHYFVGCGTTMARQPKMLYINRNYIQSYIDAE